MIRRFVIAGRRYLADTIEGVFLTRRSLPNAIEPHGPHICATICARKPVQSAAAPKRDRDTRSFCFIPFAIFLLAPKAAILAFLACELRVSNTMNLASALKEFYRAGLERGPSLFQSSGQQKNNR